MTDLDTTTAAFIGSFAADNSLVDVLLNGVSLGINGSGFASTTPFSFSCGANCNAGGNTLTFVVNNLAGSPAPAGLLVDLSGTASASGPPPAGTPEAATWTLAGAGLIAAGYFRRKK